jgi:xanthine dehydrogenase accessory factor
VVFLAKWLGYRVVVSDDREELCTPEYMPGADEFIICRMKELPSKISINAYTYFVITTRGADVDIQGLPSVLDTNPAYIGVIGSLRRWQYTKDEINKKKDYTEKFALVHSPMGLELRAETPEEIAISIMAEIMKVANGASGRSMAER